MFSKRTARLNEICRESRHVSELRSGLNLHLGLAFDSYLASIRCLPILPVHTLSLFNHIQLKQPQTSLLTIYYTDYELPLSHCTGPYSKPATEGPTRPRSARALEAQARARGPLQGVVASEGRLPAGGGLPPLLPSVPVYLRYSHCRTDENAPESAADQQGT